MHKRSSTIVPRGWELTEEIVRSRKASPPLKLVGPGSRAVYRPSEKTRVKARAKITLPEVKFTMGADESE